MTAGAGAQAPRQEYLSDILFGISTYRLDYTRVIGADTTAYPLWPKVVAGAPIRLGEKTYAKGVGAPYGEVRVMLDREYDTFEAEAGVQAETDGSAVFQVIVDGRTLFDSSPRTAKDPPLSVRVSLAGAQEMRLVAAGTGLGCWADARMTRSQATAAPIEPVDVAPYARVATWDPARMDGVRVNRLTEFPVEDVCLERDVRPGRDGAYDVPRAADSRGCLGLQWLERRRLREVALEFDGKAAPPVTEGARVEGWVLRDPLALDGYSEWQGRWTPLKGRIETEGNHWVFAIQSRDNREVSEGTLKVRWVFPAGLRAPKVRRLVALTTSRWESLELRLEAADPKPGERAEIEAYNGLLPAPDGDAAPPRLAWDMAEPLRLKVRATRPRPWGFDRTVLRFRLRGMAFGMAVDDVRSGGPVYVKEAGLFVSPADSETGLADYRRSIAGRETILAQVRRMPDQSFEDALKALYIPAQDRSPTLLSLGPDNRKVIVERTGEIGFGPMYLDFVQQRSAHRLAPRFGSGAGHAFAENGVGSPPGYGRTLDNGWMPIPRITVTEDGVTYRQAVFVAPFDQPGLGVKASERLPLCVAEYALEDTGTEPRPATLRLAFTADAQKHEPAELRLLPGRALALRDGRLLAAVEVPEGWRADADGGVLTLAATVAPGAPVQFFAYMPCEWELPVEEQGLLTGGPALRRATEDWWRQALSPSMRIEIPNPLLRDLIRASQAHCMIAARTADDGQTIDPWISSTYYASLDSESHAILRGMDLMGQHDFARKGYDFFVRRRNPAGYLSHGYTLMGTGQHLWFLSDHYRLTGDASWWKQTAPGIVKMGDWVVLQTEKTRQGDRNAPQRGLLPPGTVADWQDWGYIFSMEGYYCAGLRWAAHALADIGRPEAGRLARAADRLRRDIRRAYAWTQARTPVVPRGDGTWVPGYPYQLLKPGPCEQFFPNYSGAWIYDVELGAHHMVDEGVLDPQSRDVAWMADHMEAVPFLRESITSPAALSAEENRKDWFNKGGFPKAQPYYGRYPELCALRDDVKPFIRTYFNQLAPMLNREDMTIYENPGASVWNKTHETGHFLQQTRLMLLMERGNELWLAPYVTNRWMEDGMTVSVENAPSFFGTVGYRIVSHAKEGYIEAHVYPPDRRGGRPPASLVLRLRHPDGKPMRSVTVDGRRHTAFDPARECIRLRPGAGPITVRAEYGTG